MMNIKKIIKEIDKFNDVAKFQLAQTIKNPKIQLVLAKEENVRDQLIFNPFLSNGVIDFLLKLKNHYITEGIALRKDLSEKHQKKILKDYGEIIENILASNGNLKPTIQLKLVKRSHVQVSLAKNPNIIEKVQLILSKSMSENVLKHLAQNLNITEKVQLLLVQKNDSVVNILLAKMPHIKESVQLKLISSKDLSICFILAKNKGITNKVREELFRLNNPVLNFLLKEQ